MNELVDSDFRGPPESSRTECARDRSTRTGRAQSQTYRLYAPNMRLSKHLRGGNPAMFCFPITCEFLHNSLTVGLLKGNKGAASVRRPLCKRCLQVLGAGPAAVVAPVLLEHVVIAAKSLVVLTCAEVPAVEQSPLALQVEVVPKLKLHLSAFSWPLVSNQALRSGSEMASSSSWRSRWPCRQCRPRLRPDCWGRSLDFATAGAAVYDCRRMNT